MMEHGVVRRVVLEILAELMDGHMGLHVSTHVDRSRAVDLNELADDVARKLANTKEPV
jgi:hypothetical protein